MSTLSGYGPVSDKFRDDGHLESHLMPAAMR